MANSLVTQETAAKEKKVPKICGLKKYY